MQDRWRLARKLGPLATVPAAFAVFVWLNGGVVIGDRLMHAPVWHLVQPLYFLLFAAAALAPATLNTDRCARTSHLKDFDAEYLVQPLYLLLLRTPAAAFAPATLSLIGTVETLTMILKPSAAVVLPALRQLCWRQQR